MAAPRMSGEVLRSIWTKKARALFCRLDDGPPDVEAHRWTDTL